MEDSEVGAKIVELNNFVKQLRVQVGSTILSPNGKFVLRNVEEISGELAAKYTKPITSNKPVSKEGEK